MDPVPVPPFKPAATGAPPPPANARMTSAVSLRSNSAHAGTISAGESDHTMRTRSSRYRERGTRLGEGWKECIASLTMNAALCSLSARGSRDIVSSIWMRVSASTGSAVALGGLGGIWVSAKSDGGCPGYTHTLPKAAWTAALRTLTATTGFRARTAASKGARVGFSYGNTR